MRDYIVEMNGNCFLCLKQVSPSSSQSQELNLNLLEKHEVTVKVEDEPNVDESECPTINEPEPQGEDPSPPSPKVYSLECLSRYLRLDIITALNSRKGNTIKAILLNKLKSKTPKLNREQLKTELCWECIPLMEEFSCEYNNLEITQMKLDSLLGEIHGKIMKAEQPLSDIFGGAEDVSSPTKSLEAAEAIRKEALLKCSKRLEDVQPRINLTRLGSVVVPEPPQVTPGPSSAIVGKPPRPSRAIFIKESGRYKCRLCSKLCSRSNFHYHYSNVHLKRKFKCTKCSKEYCHKTHLQTHYKSAHIGLRFRCLDCSQTFTRKFALAGHQRTCTGVRKIGRIKRSIEVVPQNVKPSPASPGTSSTPDDEVAPEVKEDPDLDITGLVKVKMEDDDPATPGESDPLQMDTAEELDPLEEVQDEIEDGHIIVHSHPPPSIAENAFVSMPGLGPKKGNKPPWSINPENGHHKCDLCSQEFASRTTFYYHHSSVHKGISHQCSKCSKTFRHQTHYLTHYKSAHMGVRFKCLGCLKSFTRRASLTGHQKKGGCHGSGTATTTDAEASALMTMTEK